MSEHERQTVRQQGYLAGDIDMSPGGAEKRQHDRVDINTEMWCIEEYISEYVMSQSQGGIFIRSRKPLESGTRVTLKFTVILDDIETVEGEGEVVRVESSPEHMGMGVAF